MPSDFKSVVPVAVPPQSGIAHIYQPANLSAAFSIQLPASAASDPELLARFIISRQPSWIAWLIAARALMVAGFGLKTAKHLATLSDGKNAGRLGIFNIYSASQAEIVLGEDDKQLDFRFSIMCLSEAASDRRHLVASTVVQCHNRLGRVYIWVIAPFHRLVVKASLLRVARVG